MLKLRYHYLFCLLSFFHATTIHAGEVHGKVKLMQKAGSATDWTSVESNEGAVVYVTGFDEKPLQKKEKPILSQKNKTFIPRVLVVTAGEEVSFPNQDDLYHNVWSLSKVKSFDLGSYKSPDAKTVVFDKPGLVKVFCNIHPQMISTVLILKNNKYVLTDKSGDFSIKGIPPGNHQLRVWVDGSDPVVKDILVTATSSTEETFNLKLNPIVTDHLNKFGKPYSKY